MKCFVDSSFDHKRNIAGFGIVIQDGEKNRIFSNWIPCKSNNYGEIWAVYVAAILTGGQAKIFTDSECAIAYITGKIREDKPRNLEQFIEHKKMKVLAYKINRLNPEVEKIKAHTRHMKTKDIGNAMADLLAKNGRAKYYENFVLTIKKQNVK